MGRDLRAVFLRFSLTPDLTTGVPDPTATWARFDAANDGGTDAAARGGNDGATQGGKRPTPPEVRERWQRGLTSPHVLTFRRFIDGIQPDDGPPAFHFIHSLVSHHPHKLLPGGRLNKTWTDLRAERNRAASWAVVQEWQRHLLQVGFVDGMVGDLARRLKDAGLYEQSLIVITADHGASYGVPDAPLRSLRRQTAAEIMRIPLIVKYPASVRVASHVSDVNAETVDIAPTIAGAIGVDLPWPVDGASLLDPNRPSRPKTSHVGRQPSEMSAELLDVSSLLRLKIDLFGGGENPHRAPRVPALDQLLGRSLADLRVSDGGGRGELLDPKAYEEVDPQSTDLVFDVSGRFDSPRPDALVAVAVNGVVRATTRTWEANPRGWLATPPFDAWHAGHNKVEVFVAEPDAAGMLLRRVSFGQARPADLNLVSAEALTVWGLKPARFHRIEQTPSGQTFRWTTDLSEINLPTVDSPRQLEVEVLMVPEGGPREKELKIEANGRVLFRGSVGGGWAATLPLEGCDTSQGLTIRFTTPAAPSGEDVRKLGVALSRVVVR
jgi:hypothetical protein